MYATRNMGMDETAKRNEFEALFLRSHRRAYNLAYRMLGNTGEAEDVTQDAYVRAWHSFHQYDRTRPFEGWLFRIVTNLVIDCRRRQKRVPMYSLDAPLTGDADSEGAPLSFEFADTSSNPETLLMTREFDEPLEKALATLPTEYRTAVLLADVEERSYQEIADTMQCAIGTVRSRIHRARLMLRRSLEKNAAQRRRSLGAVRPAMA
jgi:RNA polymerase sigma-70 factor (ECF subfamily)